MCGLHSEAELKLIRYAPLAYCCSLVSVNCVIHNWVHLLLADFAWLYMLVCCESLDKLAV